MILNNNESIITWSGNMSLLDSNNGFERGVVEGFLEEIEKGVKKFL